MKIKKLNILIIIMFLTLLSSCRERLNSPFVDNIKQGDSLTLYAQFAECGEWGGHVEKLTLINQNNDLLANFYMDSIKCPTRDIVKVFKETKKLTAKDRNRIILYIDSFFAQRNKEQDYISNASCFFEIKNQDSIYEFVDYKTDWNDFVLMRKAIFEKY